MLIIKKKIDEALKNKNLSRYQLCKFIDFHEGSFSMILSGKRVFPEQLIEKILPVLEVSREEFEGWILADKYTKEVLELAIQAKKNFPYKRKSILTTKIDEILKEKGLSRTAFAKQINYGQSGLNQIITGKRTMSKSVLEKIAIAFEVPENEILSWIVVDKYDLRVLENGVFLLE